MLITIFGRRGSGKTTMIRGLIPTMKKPVVVIDILGNYTSEKQWKQTNEITEALTEILKSTREKNHPGIIVLSASDMSRATDYVCSALWHRGGGTIVLDEADAIDVTQSPCFDEAVRYGRNRGIDIITGCRRPAEISKNVTAGADIAYCLTTHEPRDLLYYREFLGDDAAAKLPRLAKYHGIARDFVDQQDFVFKTTPDGKIIKISKHSETVKKELKPVDNSSAPPQDDPLKAGSFIVDDPDKNTENE
jgi:hypothetical protein